MRVQLVFASVAATAMSCSVQLGATDKTADAKSQPPSDGPRQVDANGNADAVAQPDAPAPLGTPYVYVASPNGTIHVASLDEATLAIGPWTTQSVGGSISYLALHPSTHAMFGTDEGGGRVVSFAVNSADGSLTAVANRSTDNGPTHLSLDNTGQWLLVAHYNAGSVATLSADGDGNLGSPTVVAIGANSHYIQTSSDNTHAYVPCLGANVIAQRGFNSANGQLTTLANAPASVAAESGAGPRHLTMAPDGQHVWVINELNSTVTPYQRNLATGALTRQTAVSSLPNGYMGANTGAAIFWFGGQVYATNRGHNSIARFAADDATGAITLLDTTSTGGDHPRSMALDATARALVVANQNSDTISVFRLGVNGELDLVALNLSVPAAPTFVGIFRLMP